MNKRAEGLRPYIINMGIVFFFAFLIFSFAGTFLQETNPDSEVLSSKYNINKSIEDFNESMSGFQELQESMKTRLDGSNPTASEFIFLIFLGAFEIPKLALKSLVDGIYLFTTSLFPSLAGTGAGVVLGIGLGLIFSILVITLVLIIIKAIRTGETER